MNHEVAKESTFYLTSRSSRDLRLARIPTIERNIAKADRRPRIPTAAGCLEGEDCNGALHDSTLIALICRLKLWSSRTSIRRKEVWFGRQVAQEGSRRSGSCLACAKGFRRLRNRTLTLASRPPSSSYHLFTHSLHATAAHRNTARCTPPPCAAACSHPRTWERKHGLERALPTWWLRGLWVRRSLGT